MDDRADIRTMQMEIAALTHICGWLVAEMAALAPDPEAALDTMVGRMMHASIEASADVPEQYGKLFVRAIERVASVAERSVQPRGR